MWKVLDLFSGIGGFAYGLHKTNLYETVAFCEWDEGCQRVLKKHWPDTFCFSDVSNLTYGPGLYDKVTRDLLTTEVDVIVGGFPCQDISLAGKGAGLSGERSGLWSEYKRLIGEVKPKGVIIENVSALRRRGLGTVLQDLNSLGYDAEWHCIPASYFGAYHERDRIWILAYLHSVGRERLVPFQHLGKNGQGGESRTKSLQQIYDNPFGRSDSWPEPLLRREDVRLSGRVDRLKQVGNSVYWPIVEALGYHLGSNLKRMGYDKTNTV